MQDADFQFVRKPRTWGELSEVQRIVVMEKRIIIIRWIGIVLAAPIVPFLGLPHLAWIYGVIIYAVFYNFLFQFYLLPHKSQWVKKPWLLTIGDLLMTTAIVYLTGGLKSDFYDIYFLLAVLSAIRFGGTAAVMSTAMSMLAYVLTVFIHGEKHWLYAFAVIFLRMGFVGATGIFVGYVGDKARQVEYELQNELDQAHAQVNESTSLLNQSLNFSDILQTAAQETRQLIQASFSLIITSSQGIEHFPPDLRDLYARPFWSVGDAVQVSEESIDRLTGLIQDLLRVSPMLRVEASDERNIRITRVTSLVADETIHLVTGLEVGSHVNLITLPLLNAEKELGMVYLLRERTEKLRDTQKDALELFAARISASLTNALVYAQSQIHAVTDPVTSLYNHRYLHENIREELAVSLSTGNPLSLIVLDIDSFKLFNDTYGHSVGDSALKSVANVIRTTMRGRGIAARFGGDEFVLVLAQTPHHEACLLAEVLRATVLQYVHNSTHEMLSSLSISLGVATAPDCGETAEDLFQSADMALYLAKQQGKNQVRSASDLDHSDSQPKKFRLHENEMINRMHALGANGLQHNAVELQTINALVIAVDVKDHYTYDHSRHVSVTAAAIARRLNLSEPEVERIRVGALLHDIGKIGVPDSILQKNTKLSFEEYESIKQHPVIGAHIIEPISSLKMYLPIVLYHHEWYNGKGYPNGLSGEDIPFEARIVSVSDAFDAMTSDRPYKTAIPIERALGIIENMKGVQFDPRVVEVFRDVIMEQYTSKNLQVMGQ